MTAYLVLLVVMIAIGLVGAAAWSEGPPRPPAQPPVWTDTEWIADVLDNLRARCPVKPGLTIVATQWCRAIGASS